MFCVLKLSELGGLQLGRVSQHRPLKSPSPRPAPESVVSPVGDDSDRAGLVGFAAVSADDRGVAVLLADIGELIKKGLNDAEVVGQLELDRACIPLIAYLRGRQDESLGLI